MKIETQRDKSGNVQRLIRVAERRTGQRGVMGPDAMAVILYVEPTKGTK